MPRGGFPHYPPGAVRQSRRTQKRLTAALFKSERFRKRSRAIKKWTTSATCLKGKPYTSEMGQSLPIEAMDDTSALPPISDIAATALKRR
jgi:hypothetical protein